MQGELREDGVQCGKNVLRGDAHRLRRHCQRGRCDVLPSKLIDSGTDDDAK